MIKNIFTPLSFKKSLDISRLSEIKCRRSEGNSNLMPEEPKTDSSLTLRMTETCHCEDERSEDVTIQSIKLDYQVNILDSHVADAPQNDGKRAAFTLSCKTFRSNRLHALLRSRIARFSQTKCRNCVAHSYGFTLAETMIVLVILGVVAAITVPALVRNQMDAQNRTRLRKAMTVYDTAISKMVVENDFKNTIALTNWGNGNNCANTKAYFKSAQDGANSCIFRASDGVWWNISDITRPIIDLRNGDFDNPSDTRFQMFAHFGNNGELRVDDLAYEQVADFLSEDEKQLLTDLYNFANNVKKADNDIPENLGTLDFFTGLGYSLSNLTCTTNDKNRIERCDSNKRYDVYYNVIYDDSTKELEIKKGYNGLLGGSITVDTYSYSGEKKYTTEYFIDGYKRITYPDGRVEEYDSYGNLIE